MADLLTDVASNLPLYPAWKILLEQAQPKILFVWDRNDAHLLTAAGTDVQKMVPAAEIHYDDTGHFALEEDSGEIGRQIIQFFGH